MTPSVSLTPSPSANTICNKMCAFETHVYGFSVFGEKSSLESLHHWCTSRCHWYKIFGSVKKLWHPRKNRGGPLLRPLYVVICAAYIGARLFTVQHAHVTIFNILMQVIFLLVRLKLSKEWIHYESLLNAAATFQECPIGLLAVRPTGVSRHTRLWTFICWRGCIFLRRLSTKPLTQDAETETDQALTIVVLHGHTNVAFYCSTLK